MMLDDVTRLADPPLGSENHAGSSHRSPQHTQSQHCPFPWCCHTSQDHLFVTSSLSDCELDSQPCQDAANYTDSAVAFRELDILICKCD